MSTSGSTQTTKVTITKSTIKVSNTRDEKEFPRAIKKDGRYIIPWKTDAVPPSGWTNFKYFFTPDESNVPSKDKLDEEPLMQVLKPDPHRIENPPENGIRVTWMGHASVLFQLDNVNILTNPNFNDRGIKYYHPGDNTRYRGPAYEVKQLPRIDAVVISNTHFDHLDLSSVRQLNERFGEMLLWYVPVGLQEWMQKAGCANVVEMDWWREDEVDFIDERSIDKNEETKVTRVRLAFCPSQNYHSRDIDDDNAVLWGSWYIESPRYKILYCGATGYSEVFKSIGRKYGPIHMAALPIGGYNPSWKHGYGNVTPEEAIKIHKDIYAMCTLAITWGTFTIGNEFYLEPPKRLQEGLKKENLSDMQFFLLKHGESRLIEIKGASKSDGEDHCSGSDGEKGQHEGHEEDNSALQNLADQLADFTMPEDEQHGENHELKEHQEHHAEGEEHQTHTEEHHEYTEEYHEEQTETKE